MVADPEGPFADLALHSRAVDLAERIAEAEASFTTTLVAQDLPEPRTTQVLRRGEYDLPIGDPLEPGVLTVMGAFPEEAPAQPTGAWPAG